MIRSLYPGPVPGDSWWRFLRHPDPDSLVDLAARFNQGRSADAARLSREFSEVVSSIRVGRTHKLTRPNRLEAPTAALSDRLRPAPGAPLEFLDVGASDGITTLEAVRMFETRLGRPVRACLIDPFIRLIRYRAGSTVEYRTPDQSPVMVRVGPIGLQLSSLDTARDPLSRGLGLWYLGRTSARESMQADASISLVNPLVAADPSVTVFEWDVLRHNPAFADRFHAVRASNVLNHSYFSSQQIGQALSNLHAYLIDGGSLLVSRSRVSGSGEVDHGSIWRKEGGRFVSEHTFGDGAEIAELVDQFASYSAAPKSGAAPVNFSAIP
jgi:hypothetical protein